MSLFDDDRFHWRETFFVLFHSAKRPLLDDVAEAVRALPGRYDLTNSSADEQGLIESLTVFSPEDHAALDIAYLTGNDVEEEGASLADQVNPGAGADPQIVDELGDFDARFDVMHFEQLSDALDPADEPDEMFDPSTLLVVLDVLIDLTGGVAVDPQSGTTM